MQQINTERRQASVRLPRQLPANIIKETTSPIHRKNVSKISQSAPARFEKLTGENQQQWPSRRWQTDLDEFNTHRSLSSIPTYSSLSRHTPETYECATQITTITPTEIVEDNSEIPNDFPISIDNNQLVLVDEIPVEEVELMPVSSGFGNYPYNYPTTRTQRVVRPQILSRAPKFRDKNQNGINSNPKTTGKSPPQRPTAVKQSPRSDTSSLLTKRNETNPRVPKDSQVQNGSRRPPPTKQKETNPRVPKDSQAQNGSRRPPLPSPPKKSAVMNSPPPIEKRRTEPMRRNLAPRPIPKYSNSPVDQQDYGRKPVSHLRKHSNVYYRSSPPAYHQNPASLPRDTTNRPRRMRVANNEYIIQRRTRSPVYAYDDYRTESPIERRNPQRVVRVVHDAPYREDDDVYYVEPAPHRRPPAVRRSAPKEYVYIDEKPPTVRQHRSRSHHPEVVYVEEEDEEPPAEYEDEYIYVDEDGNEVDFANDRNQSPHYVEYIYDDEKDKRRSHKSKVVYVDDERNKKKSKHPSSTRVVYE